MRSRFEYRMQSVLADIVFGVFALLPPRLSSQLGGALLSALGTLFKSQNKRVLKHIALAMPETSMEERHRIKNEMWRNLGMILGEYPHLGKFVDGHKDFKLEITGNVEHLDPQRGNPFIFVSGHLGNWEILPIVCKRLGVPFHPMYRAPNNPFVDAKLAKLREAGGRLPKGFPKSRQGLKDMTEALRRGATIGILVDQRHSGGTDLDFFGHTAQTAMIAADLALKYDAVLMAGRIIRRGPCDFLFDTRTPFEVKGQTSAEIMQKIYRQLEEWIREYPSQWLWTHQRWGKNI